MFRTLALVVLSCAWIQPSHAETSNLEYCKKIGGVSQNIVKAQQDGVSLHDVLTFYVVSGNMADPYANTVALISLMTAYDLEILEDGPEKTHLITQAFLDTYQRCLLRTNQES